MTTTLRCPYCNAKGLKNLGARHAGFYSIIHCTQCGAIHGIVPAPKKDQPASTPPAQEQSKKQSMPASQPPEKKAVDSEASLPPPAGKHPGYLAEIGQADLSEKIPYSPEKIANRMKAAGMGQATKYLRVAIDQGPPVCVKCKTEMDAVTIPADFLNEGVNVWVCPNYDKCKEWELAEQ